MRFFPVIIETRYFQGTPESLVHHISRFIKADREESETNFIFHGNISKEQFSISLLLKLPTRNLPQVQGKIIPGDRNVRIEITYELPESTRNKLLVWAAIPIFLTLFFILGYNAWLYGSICGGFGLVNYILAREQFAKQVRKSQRALDRLFS